MPIQMPNTPFQNGLKTIPVSHLVSKIKNFLENKVNMTGVLISGEISNLRPAANGHLYFNLKDESAAMSCIMWSSARRSLNFVPEDGMSVVVGGSINVYEKRGTMSLNCYTMQQTGIGLLYQQLEELKRKLDAQGYFNPAHKKPKPSEINRIGVVTGENTAALQDVLKTIRTRWPMLSVTLFPTLVQGEKAPADIVRQLQNADTYGFDAILLVRGGGSFEDLFCFNDENIVRTLYQMKTYTVSGIGHEIDTSLADLAADHRAVTPTAAAQWVTQDQREVMAWILQSRQRIINQTRRIFDGYTSRLMMIESYPYLSNPLSYVDGRKQKLAYLNAELEHCLSRTDQQAMLNITNQKNAMITAIKDRLVKENQNTVIARSLLEKSNPQKKIAEEMIDIENIKKQLKQQIERCLQNEKRKLNLYNQLLEAGSPQKILEKGYAIIERDGKLLRNPMDAVVDDHLKICMNTGCIEAQVLGVMMKEDNNE